MRNTFHSYFQLGDIENTIIHLEKYLKNLKKENHSEFYNKENYQHEIAKFRMTQREILDSIQNVNNAIIDNKRLLEYHENELKLLTPNFKKIKDIKEKIYLENKKIDKLEKKYHKLLFKISPMALIFEKFVQSNNTIKSEKLVNEVLITPNFLHSPLAYSYFDIGLVLNDLRRVETIKKIRYDIINHNNQVRELSEKLYLIKESVENNGQDYHVKNMLKNIEKLNHKQKKLLSEKIFLENEEKKLKERIVSLSKLLDNIECNQPLFESYKLKLKLCCDAISLGNDLKSKVIENEIFNFNEIFNNKFIKNSRWHQNLCKLKLVLILKSN